MNRVVVLTGMLLWVSSRNSNWLVIGGANGIGAATVKRLAASGAYVVFGDIDYARGSALAASLPERTHFLATDVTKYASILALFDKAMESYGRVDVAISNAGVVEKPGWFEPNIDIESIRIAPSTTVLDINLSTLYFSRIAAVYLRQHASPTDDKNLILLSSVAGFKESPGLFVYQAAKHGVIGLMRSLRKFFPTAYHDMPIRVNCVCPWATETTMTETFQKSWIEAGIPLNTPEDVAKTIVDIAIDKGMNGESMGEDGL